MWPFQDRGAVNDPVGICMFKGISNIGSAVFDLFDL